ncbi:hypothetical protein D018_1275A, partial [Vibrio parahaemolyticus VP2007-007]
MSSAKPR